MITTPGSKQAAALDVAGLRARFPGLVVLSITPFGNGAYRSWQATDPVLQALGSQLFRTGTPRREPLLAPG
ncbi:MAG: CoA transferase, partial [Steroidobacteraceae bacterium]